jgi:hypothetical protein
MAAPLLTRIADAMAEAHSLPLKMARMLRISM